jgi:RND family efflux transporter MFP subunit
MALLWVFPTAVVGQSALETAAVRHERVKREYVAEGLIEAVNQSTVSAQTSGRVQEILFDVNDFVEKGSVIVRLVDAEQRAGVEQAEAGVAESEARFRQAGAEFERVQQVFERGLVAKSALDSAQAELKSAQARVEGARAALERTAEQLAYTSVKAPYSGIVLGRHVQIGEAVQPGQSLLSGVSLEALRIVTQVPQRLVDAVRRHQQVRILIDPQRGVDIAAERLTIFPYADPQTGTFKVRAHLPRGTEGLYPGMFVKTAFTIGETQEMLAPREAIVRRSEVTGVYVVDDSGRIRLRQVRVGRATNGSIVVLAGLDVGERVALDPIRAGIELKTRQEPVQ